jgi:hypothetical protein
VMAMRGGSFTSAFMPRVLVTIGCKILRLGDD